MFVTGHSTSLEFNGKSSTQELKGHGHAAIMESAVHICIYHAHWQCQWLSVGDEYYCIPCPCRSQLPMGLQLNVMFCVMHSITALLHGTTAAKLCCWHGLLRTFSGQIEGSVGRLCASWNDVDKIVVGQNAWYELYMYRIQPLELQFDLSTPGRHRRRADCL